jgi:ABC-type sugar transport system ATPase subunit
LRGVTLEIDDGSTLAVLGPSGCGKTTLLRTIAGLENPDSGAVAIDGRDVRGEPPERRSVGFVFQRYALYPHLSVAANVAYGPAARGVARAEIERRVRAALLAMRVDEALWTRKPASLSGGQQQRVALARALAITEPRRAPARRAADRRSTRVCAPTCAWSWRSCNAPAARR